MMLLLPIVVTWAIGGSIFKPMPFSAQRSRCSETPPGPPSVDSAEWKIAQTLAESSYLLHQRFPSWTEPNFSNRTRSTMLFNCINKDENNIPSSNDDTSNTWHAGHMCGHTDALKPIKIEGVGCSNFQQIEVPSHLIAAHRFPEQTTCLEVCRHTPRCVGFDTDASNVAATLRQCTFFTDDCHMWPNLQRNLFMMPRTRLGTCYGAITGLEWGSVIRYYVEWEHTTGRTSRYLTSLVDSQHSRGAALAQALSELRMKDNLFGDSSISSSSSSSGSTSKSVNLNAYWSLAGFSTNTLTFDQMLIARTSTMYNQMKHQNRVDVLVEKNKCMMNSFLHEKGLPHTKVLGRWGIDDASSFANYLVSLPDSAFPFLIKFCHLTQGSQNSEETPNTVFVRSRDSLASKMANPPSEENLARFIQGAFSRHGEDPDRPWTNWGANSILTELNRPGVFVQAAFPSFDGLKGVPIEAKVSVVWGVAVGLRIEGGGVFVLRGRCRPLFTGMHWGNDDMINFIKKMPLHEFCRHVKAIFRLAERDAASLDIDYIRSDIFLNALDPDSPVINEHSLYEMGHNGMDLLGPMKIPVLSYWRMGYQEGSNVKTLPYSALIQDSPITTIDGERR